MERYHKKVGIPDTIKNQFEGFTGALNTKKWLYTRHSIANLKYRCYDIKSILLFIKGLELKENDIFEVYVFDSKLVKVCYRVEYKNIDLILVVDSNKTLITIYVNTKDDKHYTLNETIYNKK